jgi:heterodisulfide reductase subunit A
MSEKVGVYICHCGTNISAKVDVEHVAEWAGDQANVEVSRDYKFMCSSLGQDLIEEDIKEKGLTRVVVAACSPHMHEKTFRSACDRAGLNPFLFEMANIREHNSWITDDKEMATIKAKALVEGAVERVVHQEPLEPIPVEINPNTLVVGGGIAGISAALELADAGHHVYLVERDPSIGGHMAQLDKTFPTLDCSACILTPKMVDVMQHPHITLYTWSEVEEVGGYLGQFTATVRKKARYVDEEHCTGCGICIEKCPIRPNSIDFEQEDELIRIEVGNIILATGYDLFDCKKIPQYGYGRLPNVFTSLEFERMVNSAGPTDGKITLRDSETEPKSVAIVHCVGSRDENYHEYCSNMCCMYSLKFAHLVHERIPDAEVYNCYIDIRTPGKGYEEFYHRLLNEGTHFIRGKVAEITDFARLPEEEGKLVVQVEDTLIGKQRRLPVDMVILSPAIEARHDSKEVSLLFGMGCDFDGFFVERHPKLDPVATMTDGIFIAGACQGPKDVPYSVAQGAAAAARVAGLIDRGTVMMEPVRASVIKELCSGCRICNNMCPYGAILFLEEEKVTEITTALCQGCGSCVAACPSAAITGAHFTNDQLMSQIDGILWDMRVTEEPEHELVTV